MINWIFPVISSLGVLAMGYVYAHSDQSSPTLTPVRVPTTGADARPS
jgi:hypothetical protein